MPVTWSGLTIPPRIDGLIRADIAHLWFVTLHPFEDGNGRLARAITDMALSQDEGQPMRLFSLSARILRERDAYYKILERTQRGGLNVTEWLAWFLVQVEASAATAEQTLANTLAKARFWLRHQATILNQRQHKMLDRLLNAGPGGFEGGMSTRKYMSLTKTSRGKRRCFCNWRVRIAGRSSPRPTPWRKRSGTCHASSLIVERKGFEAVL